MKSWSGCATAADVCGPLTARATAIAAPIMVNSARDLRMEHLQAGRARAHAVAPAPARRALDDGWEHRSADWLGDLRLIRQESCVRVNLDRRGASGKNGG